MLVSIRKEVEDWYSDCSLKTKIHLYIRCALAPFEILERHVPDKGLIVDLGCGYGFFANFLALKSSQRYLISVDLDNKKILEAERTVKGRKNIEFFRGDIGKIDLPHCQSITMIDLCHHIPFKNQEILLGYCYERLVNNGCLILKDIGLRPRWKYIANFLHDCTIHPGRKIYCRTKEEYLCLLSKIGFKTNVIKLNKLYLPLCTLFM